MVSKCANPNCERELRYLRDGRVFVFEVMAATGEKRHEYFWLCGECSKLMQVTRAADGGVRAVPRSDQPIAPDLLRLDSAFESAVGR